MIPLQKLERLPRSQRLRKIAKLFTEAEYRLSLGETPTPDKIAYLQNIAALLIRDDSFSPAALQALNSAAVCLQGERPEDIGSIRRALNTVRHILRTETGQQTADWDFIDHDGKLDSRKREYFPGMQVYLEDIRSPFNVGAMFRAAESFGVEKIFLSPLCADPTHPRAKRTAMGCVDILPWERLGIESTVSTIQFPPALSRLPLFALETGGTDITRFPFPQEAVMIVGSEELGVSHEALAAADASLGRVSIPSYGAKGSLNASVAFGIALQAWAAALVLQETT